MNKVIEYVLKAKDLVSSTLTRISGKFKEVGDSAEKAAKQTQKMGGGGGEKGALQVFNDEMIKSTGLFGKVSSALGSFGGMAAAAIGAFKVGWDIGTWVNDKVITPLFGIKDAEEELIKHNRAMKRAAEEAFRAWSESLDELDSSFEKTTTALQEQRNGVEDLAAAYQRLQQAQGKVIAAENDAQILALQRAKFNEMGEQNRAGNSVGASQIGLDYDIQIAQAKQAQELAKFDRESAAGKWATADAQRALNKLLEEQWEVQNRSFQIMEQRHKVEQEAEYSNYDAEMKRVDQMEKQNDRRAEQLAREIRKRQNEIKAQGIENGAREQERANLAERLQMEIDEKTKAYDDFIQQQQDEEYQAFLEEQEREQAELDRQRAEKLAADLEAERKLHSQRVKDVQQELAESSAAQSAAQADLAAAKAQVSKAWGWYRNKDSMQAVIDEKKAQEEAEKQFEKDFERLKNRRRDWRTVEMGKLSVEDEATRQVALAKEAEAAAQKALDQISENTAAIRDIYEALTGGDE